MPEPSYRFMDVGIFLAYFCKRNFRHLWFVLKQERDADGKWVQMPRLKRLQIYDNM